MTKIGFCVRLIEKPRLLLAFRLGQLLRGLFCELFIIEFLKFCWSLVPEFFIIRLNLGEAALPIRVGIAAGQR